MAAVVVALGCIDCRNQCSPLRNRTMNNRSSGHRRRNRCRLNACRYHCSITLAAAVGTVVDAAAMAEERFGPASRRARQ